MSTAGRTSTSTHPPAEAIFAELSRYVRFGPDDSRALEAARPHVESHFERIAQEFYDRTREHQDAHAVFRDEDQISRLQRSLVLWMKRVFTGPHDEQSFEQTLKIGRVHAQLELPQRYMVTGMAVLRLELTRIVTGAMGAAAIPSNQAIHKVIDLELAGMLESYRQDSMTRLELRQREATEALLRTEHRYVNAVELANVLVVGVSPEGRILLFNREAERVTGYVREELVGFLFTESLAEADENITALIAESLAGQRPEGVVVESTLRTRAGKLRNVRWQLVHSPSAADDVALFAIGSDVTDERLQAERNRQQEKLAAVGILAAGLAHEIRNPLNGAQLHIAFLDRALKKQGGDPEMLEAVSVVADEIRRLALLVSEFLDFARPKPLELKRAEARALLGRVSQLAQAKAEQASAKITLDLPAREIEFTADPGKLEQVLLNMVLNAIEAVETTGGGTITLRTRQKPRDVLFEVEDNGPGLTSPEAPIFDAFFSTKPQGTGLGLSISHRIVTDHGGEISVETRPGRTVFRFTVPLALA